jgi:DNA-3-methyladenine glycosylase II
LQPQQPYRFDLLLAMLSRAVAPPLFRVTDNACYRAFRMGAGLALVRVLAYEQALQIESLASTSPIDEALLRQQVTTVLGVNISLKPFYQVAKNDPVLWAWLEPLVGMPQHGCEDLYEALLTTIIEQHIAWTAALKIQRRLVELFGDSITHEGITYYVLPTPQRFASLTPQDLAPLKLTTARTQLLLDIARMTADGTLDWSVLRHLPHHELYTRLMQLKGVGHWTASVTIGRACGVNPYVNDNDVALQAAVNTFFYGLPKRASLQTTREAFAPYGVWAGTVANFLMTRWVLEKYPANALP